jgi:hypothetical protein
LDAEVIELQFDFRNTLAKIAPHVVHAHVEPSHPVSAAL